MGTPEPFDCQLQQLYTQLQQAQQRGLLSALGGVGSALWSTRSTQPEPYSNQFQPQPYSVFKVPDKHRMIKFFRVNEKVEVPEGAVNEPLDELRIKVAKWLYN